VGRAQADVLEAIAKGADDKLDKWELALRTACSHWQRGGAQHPPQQLLSRIASQLQLFAAAIAEAVTQAARAAPAAAGLDATTWRAVQSGHGGVEWQPRCASAPSCL
jgi:hypothetical protein